MKRFGVAWQELELELELELDLKLELELELRRFSRNSSSTQNSDVFKPLLIRKN